MIRRQRQARSAPSALPGNLLAGAVICLLGIFLQHSEVLATSGVVVGWGKYAVNGDLRWGLIAINSGAHAHILGIREDGSILAWGDDGYGACNVPLPNSDFVAVSAGGAIQGPSHSLGLRSDGSVVACGDNSYGQCEVPEPNAGFVSISAGHRHSLGLKNDGSIVAWGSSDFGECNVPLPNTDFRAVAAGFLFSVGLKSDSTIEPPRLFRSLRHLSPATPAGTSCVL